MMDINVASDLSGEEIRIVEKIMDYVESHKKHLVLDGAEKETYRYEDGTIAVEYHLGKIDFVISLGMKDKDFTFLDLNGFTGFTDSFEEFAEMAA